MSEAPTETPLADWTPELVTMKAIEVALMEVLGRKKARRFLQAMAHQLNKTVSHSATLPLHGDRQRQAQRHNAAKIAVATFKRDLPHLLYAIP